jgi:ABC-type Fe3+/spermidine/putrescine transport system ATPase subunit
MVRLEHVRKTYPGRTQPAIDDLSLNIQEGEIFCLVGPSGCGKTTTLRIVAGLEKPDAGAIYFKDRPIVVVSDRLFVPPERRQIGMVFQSYAIWPHMTVEENVAFPLRVRRVSAREIGDRVERILDLVGLRHLAKQPAPLLSGGQQQRMALARALVYEPGLLLLDEPFSNLDTQLREQMRIEVKLLQARLRVTVLFVTHDQVEALSLSNRMAVMNHGRVQQVGHPRELYEQPANVFVRDFLGKTVTLRGEAKSCDPNGILVVAVNGLANGLVRGRTSFPEPLRAGQPIMLSLRPEDASLKLVDDRDDATIFDAVLGTIEAALFVGDRTEYRIRLPEQGPILVYGDRRDCFEEGRDVWIKLPPDRVSVWPADDQ